MGLQSLCNMESKQVLFTFDYELFLGHRSGSVENCMILPTKKLLEVLKKYRAKVLF